MNNKVLLRGFVFTVVLGILIYYQLSNSLFEHAAKMLTLKHRTTTRPTLLSNASGEASRSISYSDKKRAMTVHTHMSYRGSNMSINGSNMSINGSNMSFGGSNMSNKAVVNTNETECNDPFKMKYLKENNFIFYNIDGRFGNQMFQYASSYGIASYTNKTLLLIGHTSVPKYFNVTAPTVEKCVTKDTPKRWDKKCCSFDESLMNLPTVGNYQIGNSLQSYKYFEHVQDEVRKEFTFVKEVRDKASIIINQTLQVYMNRTKRLKQSFRPVLVGVHVRRGDMVDHPRGYDVATPGYLLKAINHFRDKFKEVIFLVCSDSMNWTKEHVQGDDVLYIENNHYAVDMAVLTSCDHSVITVGTFSWWIGYLTGGEVLYYKKWFKEGARLRNSFSKDYADFFPPHWIGMT